MKRRRASSSSSRSRAAIIGTEGAMGKIPGQAGRQAGDVAGAGAGAGAGAHGAQGGLQGRELSLLDAAYNKGVKRASLPPNDGKVDFFCLPGVTRGARPGWPAGRRALHAEGSPSSPPTPPRPPSSQSSASAQKASASAGNQSSPGARLMLLPLIESMSGRSRRSGKPWPWPQPRPGPYSAAAVRWFTIRDSRFP